PTITIVFAAAEGIEAGKTFVKYKDVNIGQVTAVALAENYAKVEVTAKIDKSAAGLMVEDAKFWVVEPRVTLGGVSGLSTLLSGNYIGFQAGKSAKGQRRFTGLDVEPTITDQPGRKFVLKAHDLGSLGIGSPIYYRRLQVGEVAAHDLAADGKSFEITVFVNAPYEKYVNPETRFWNASGIDVSVDADGLDVRTESLLALLAGGLAFDTPAFLPSDEPAAENTAFKLYPDRATAMKQPEAIARRYVLNFTESVQGLEAGTPVTLFGLPVGEVTEVGLSFDPATQVIKPNAHITFYPERAIERLSSQEKAASQSVAGQSAETRLKMVRHAVEDLGLRAQLRSGNLLTGQLYVAFEYFPKEPKPQIDWSQDPLELPVVRGGIADMEAKLDSILTKIDNMPIDAIGADLKKALATLAETLKEADKLVKDIDADTVPELKTTLVELRRMMATAERVLKDTDATLLGKDAPVQQELRDALQEVARAARSVRVLTDELERHPEALIRGKTEE
ncbi:MAG: MlaD family protein, partial [Rhodospirillales bacterium]|nr:MlaD family protein [Rhodospirillales bacterium]